MKVGDWISALAALIAFFAFLLSWKSYVIARKAHGIAEEGYKNQIKEISSYLIESYKWKSEEKKYVTFAVSYTNEATIQNSISFLCLKLRLNNANKKYPEVSVSPVSKEPTMGNYKALEFPLLLGGRETKSGWITFELPSKLLEETTVETYTLEAETASGNIVKTKTNLVTYVVE